MKKNLFISSMDIFASNYGGSKCALRNYEMLRLFFNVEAIIMTSNIKTREKYKREKKIEFLLYNQNKIIAFIRNLFRYTNNFSYQNEKKILKLIKEKKYDFVFIDTSSYGRLAKEIKKINSNIKIITFFHNIEYDFVNSLISSQKNIIKKTLFYLKLKSVMYNETLAVEYSDFLINLNERDNKRMFDIYGRSSDLLLPITLEDEYIESNIVNKEKYILFIGSLFFANYNGIKWFINNVMPEIKDKKLVVVGKGFEAKREELERKNVQIIGEVDDLKKYYREASCLVMPIFEGAGMKVKTAEALMWGKTIYGTTEAFEGYEIDYSKVGGLCNTKEEFIKKLNNDQSFNFNDYSRKIFIEKYSFLSSKEIFNNFLKENNLL